MMLSVHVVTESTLVFNVPKCLGQFAFKFVAGILCGWPVCVRV